MKRTREVAKELLPFVQALAEGKMIQDKIEGLTGWVDTEEINLEFDGQKILHRIKPEHEYRPFKTQEECWQEMLKHQPFGWVIRDFDKEYTNIITVTDDKSNSNAPVSIGLFDDLKFRAIDLFKAYKFADGAPFGMSEEE